MRTPLLLGLFFALFSPLATFSQPANVECEEVVDQAESYLNSTGITPEKSKALFDQVKSCAVNGNPDAACLMGVLYKDGIGCTLDFDKAREWFSYAHVLGSEKAAYSLGYLYLKGMGSIEQDYDQAIQWFEKSNYGMASHWLAKCYYYGLGVPKDREKAMALLRDNPIYNSQTLLAQWETHDQNKEDNTVSGQEIPDQVLAENSQGLAYGKTETDLSSHALTGQWQGTLYEMDWSGEKVLKVRPIGLELSASAGSDLSDNTTIFIAGKKVKSPVFWHGRSFMLPDARISIAQDFADHPAEKELDFEIISLSLEEKAAGGNTCLVAQVETWIANWSEPGPPMVMVLYKDTPGEGDIPDLLEQQGEATFAVYPNPFVQDILIQYELEAPSPVEVSLYDYNGRLRSVAVAERNQQKGRHTLTIQGHTLSPGIYIVQVKIAGKKYSKQVLKK